MFNKTFGNVTIQTKAMPKRGACLHISKEDGEYILADYCGMNPMLVPDGTNAYFFGNKLILVTRWSDMSDEEKNTVENSPIVLAAHPYPCLQFSIKIGDNWGDVMVSLHNFSERHNDVDLPVDKIIFIFADTHDSDYVTSRTVDIPSGFQKFLQKANQNSIKKYSLDGMLEIIRLHASTDPTKDEFDFIYDLCYEETKAYSREARKHDPSNIPDGIYISINENNKITDIHQHEYVEAVKMSDEVKMYLQLAQQGIAPAQYNLGVCYERGDGVDQNYEQALYWYKKAADQGDAKALHNLALCFYNGYGTEADPAEAARLFKLSADAGDMYAQHNLGIMYLRGDGVKLDPITGIEYLKKAANNGHPQAKAFIEKFNL